MSSATLILWVITLVLLAFSWRKGSDTINQGFNLAWKTTKQNALLIILAFVIVGFVNILSPEELVQAWIGPGSGWRGIVSAEFLGMFLPGGPYVVFPIIAILTQAGA
ncbi:MAG: hypothetical protein HQ574_04165, partial [Chloroflexi bacterium]|nr:hypothetical protein [Chloroflexota bacterium]